MDFVVSNDRLKCAAISGINAPIQRFVTWPAPMTKCSSLSQGNHTLICKLQMEIKWEIKTYLFCSWICCGAKWNENCSTMQKRCLRRRFVRKFHNVVFYLVCLAFHCWYQAVVIIVSRFTVNGIAVPLINNQQWRQITQNKVLWNLWTKYRQKHRFCIVEQLCSVADSRREQVRFNLSFKFTNKSVGSLLGLATSHARQLFGNFCNFRQLFVF